MRSMLKQKLTRPYLIEKLEQLLILVAHLALLKWILYTLYEGGEMNTTHLLLHFLGIGVYGSLLIWGTAKITQRRYLKQKNHGNNS